MTLHQTFYEWSHWIWPLLANHLWQTTLLAILAWIAVSLLRGATARPRYLVWMIAFVKFLAPSAWLIFALAGCGIEISRPRTSTGVEIFFQIAQPVSPAGGDAEGVRIGETSLAAADGALRRTGHSELDCLLTMAWLLGAGVWLTRWFLLRRRFARTLEAGSSIADGPEAAALERARARLSFKREIGLIESPEVSEPGVWRSWRPVVVLPQGLAGRLSAQELEALMMHELIHVSRFDNLLGTAQLLICCCFWFHPLVWLIDRRLLAERELVCDEEVIRQLGDAKIYAAGLWKVAQFGLGWNLAGVSRVAGSNLKRRIELMLDIKHRTRLSIAARAITLSAVATLLVAAFTMAIFTRDRAEAKAGLAARQEQGQTVLPMQYQNQSEIPLAIIELQATLSEARGVPGAAPEFNRSEEMERDLNLAVKLLNQGERPISGVAFQLENRSLWQGDGILLLAPTFGEKDSEKIVIQPQATITINKKERVKERSNGVDLLSAVGGFRLKVVGVMLESDQSWIWAKNAGTPPAETSAGLHPQIEQYVKKAAQFAQASSQGQDSEEIEPMSANLRPTILYKEKAKYTDQARENGIEGTVVLNVVFRADGRITQFRVVRGLPDGLTEQAIEATRVIRFEPAVKNGQRVSVRGNLEFGFNLGKDPSTERQDEAADYKSAQPMSAFLRPTIIYKEKAVYTDEARSEEISGKVILNVVFGADGRIGSIRIVSGLPYGLTEKAIEAAQKIRFEPALLDGKPVSVKGNLEYSFDLY